MTPDARHCVLFAATLLFAAGCVTAPRSSVSDQAARMVLSMAAARPAVAAPAFTAAPRRTVVRPSATTSSAATSSAAASSGTALAALGTEVRMMSDPSALGTAFRAYYAYRAANPGAVRKPYLYYVDFGLDNGTARGYVFDMENLSVVDGPFMVSHGRGSSDSRDGVPTWFSNRPNSYATSLGLYLAEETYTFRGTSNGRSYSSVGLRLRGESGAFNSQARRRGIVAHGAPYVTGRDAGRSEGCPAMEPERANRLLPLIADGGVVFIYSPNDRQWLSEDPWITAAD